jgi:hypothetical protein
MRVFVWSIGLMVLGLGLVGPAQAAEPWETERWSQDACRDVHQQFDRATKTYTEEPARKAIARGPLWVLLRSHCGVELTGGYKQEMDADIDALIAEKFAIRQGRGGR